MLPRDLPHLSRFTQRNRRLTRLSPILRLATKLSTEPIPIALLEAELELRWTGAATFPIALTTVRPLRWTLRL